MERVTENIYTWTGHRELTEKDRKYLAELKKDTEGVFGEPIDEKEAMKLTKKEHLTGQDLQNHIDTNIAKGKMDLPNFELEAEATAYLTILRGELAKLAPVKTKKQTPFFRSYEECEDYYVAQAKSKTVDIDALKVFCLNKYGNDKKVAIVFNKIKNEIVQDERKRVRDAYVTAEKVFDKQSKLVQAIESLQVGIYNLKNVNKQAEKETELGK